MLVTVCALFAISSARPQYPARIPNGPRGGSSGINCTYFGHLGCVPGAPRNPFGLAFEREGLQWTRQLCEEDSDGDGQTNGQELGDPCCIWSIGNDNVLRMSDLSHPGDPNIVNSAAPTVCPPVDGEGEEGEAPTPGPGSEDGGGMSGDEDDPVTSSDPPPSPGVSPTSTSSPDPSNSVTLASPTPTGTLSFMPTSPLTPSPTFTPTPSPSLSLSASSVPTSMPMDPTPIPDAGEDEEDEENEGDEDDDESEDDPDGVPGAPDDPNPSDDLFPGGETSSLEPSSSASPGGDIIIEGGGDVDGEEDDVDDVNPSGSPDISEESTDGGDGDSDGDGTDDDAVCFSADATVQLSDGRLRRMAELQLGDQVLVGSGAYSPVFMFTHAERDTHHGFITLHARDPDTSRPVALTLTAGHYVYSSGRLVRADAVRSGDLLDLVRASKLSGYIARVPVEAVTRSSRKGLYNPQTLHGDIVVDGFRVSTYTHAVHSKTAHSLLLPLRMLFRVARWSTKAFERGASRIASYMPKHYDL